VRLFVIVAPRAAPLRLLVGPESELWQNGWLDLNAVWGGEWDRSRDGYGVEIVEGQGTVLGVNVGKCGTSYRNQWGLCGVDILCRGGWRRGSSKITLWFLVYVLHLQMALAVCDLLVCWLKTCDSQVVGSTFSRCAFTKQTTASCSHYVTTHYNFVGLPVTGQLCPKGWEGNRRSGVAVTMRHRRNWFILPALNYIPALSQIPPTIGPLSFS